MADDLEDGSPVIPGTTQIHPTDSDTDASLSTGTDTDNDNDDADLMNDPSYDRPALSKTHSTTDDSLSKTHSTIDDSPTCRICRSESTPEEPLFHPCKCSGSIKHVHQECLMEWLSHSHKKHCELCKTPFRFTKLYDADMPSQLPWRVFVQRAVVHVGLGLQGVLRGVLVGVVWMVILPWFIRWAWRWMFWFADAGWARDLWLHRARREGLAAMAREAGTSSVQHVVNETGLPIAYNVVNKTGLPIAYNLASELLGSMGIDWLQQNNSATTFNQTTSPPPWPQADASIFSSWTYLAEMTPNPALNRMILDIFEGQLITCVVIIGFILVFLIREWVVQQQPLVANNIDQAQQQIREATEQMRINTERLRAQQVLLEEAQRQLDERENFGRGWERLEKILDQGAEMLEGGDKAGFEANVRTASAQIYVTAMSQRQSPASSELGQRVHEKLETYEGSVGEAWETALEAALEKKMSDGRKGRADHDQGNGSSESGPAAPVSASTSTRPHMPERALSSRATQVQRLLEETDALLSPRQGGGEASGQDESRDGEQPHAANTSPGEGSSSSVSSWQNVTPQSESSQHGEQGTAPDNDPQSIPQHPPLPRANNDPQPSPNSLLDLNDSITGINHTLDQISNTLNRPLQKIPSSVVGDEKEEIPITNAGPDAKVNIRRSGKGKGRAVPEPKEKGEGEGKGQKGKVGEGESQALNKAGLPTGRAEVAELQGEGEGEAGVGNGEEEDVAAEQESDGTTRVEASTPAQAPVPIEDSLSHRVASVFREEFGLDEAEELEREWQADLRAGEMAELRAADEARGGGDDDNAEVEGSDDNEDILDDDGPARQPDQPRPKSCVERAADWFWGDIQVTDVPAPAPVREARARPNNDADIPPAPDAPVAAAAAEPQQDPEQRDPEVVAAAAQAGLDAEAIEDAEDLEGILELLGIQGPLVGLFQTSMFCLVLVAGTVLAAVDLPYIWGKLVLNFIGSPVYFVFTLPLQIASFGADLVIDTSLLAGAWAVSVASLCAETLFSLFRTPESWFERLGMVTDAAAKTASASWGRLQALFLAEATTGSTGWNGAFLGASVHAHASLKALQAESDAVLEFFWQCTVATVNSLSSGSVTEVARALYSAARYLPSLPAKAGLALQSLGRSTQPFLTGLRTGALTLSVPETSIDPSLIFWSSNDRYLAILTGYAALALLATIYCTIDKPLLSSPSAQKTEKQIRDTLRQAGGVLKVILIISIEMLVFPLYCGLLLDLAFLPLFADATLATRLAFAARNPYSFAFLHWFLGTCYMFHFALFVGMCRKILRKGVLWFIRDPDDPTFHPVRDVLERNVATQLRKIAFSALVYGALVILCLGGVIWGVGRVLQGVFPVHWVGTEPVLEFPADLLVFNFLTPVVVRLARPGDLVGGLYAWWLRRCARVLRLSHFLFEDRRKDEEGRVVHGTWRSLLPRRETGGEGDGAEGDVAFRRDGKFVLTPCNDQYRPPKAGEAFLHSADDGSGDVYIADKDGKRNEHFAAIYVPPLFRVRVSAFMVCLWLFSAFTGLCVTLVPLVFGRTALAALAPGVKWNDIYAYALGAYTLGGVGFAVLRGGDAVRRVRQRASALDLPAWVAKVRGFVVKGAKCAYVYGFLGLVLPLVFALVLQFYLILPLHTYAVSAAAAVQNQPPTAGDATTTGLPNSTTSTTTAAPTTPGLWLANHTLHILQDYALGLLYVRLATQSIFRAPSSRFAEAFRRVTAAGYLNPSALLATRIFILPLLVLSAVILLLPAAAAHTLLALPLACFENLQDRTLVYRYAYPVFAGAGLVGMGVAEGVGATRRWRLRIRDEVYLVGEKLHNWNEARPPKGAKSVVRRPGGTGRVVEGGVGEHEL